MRWQEHPERGRDLDSLNVSCSALQLPQRYIVMQISWAIRNGYVYKFAYVHTSAAEELVGRAMNLKRLLAIDSRFFVDLCLTLWFGHAKLQFGELRANLSSEYNQTLTK
eukprot:3665844-Amphidinium_carterae.1